MKQELTFNNRYKNIHRIQSYLTRSSQFWSIVVIFILITLHHYDDITRFSILSAPDLPLGLTRHTIDRILYLIPIFLSSFAFGSRGGKVVIIAALIAMLPRALFISPSSIASLWETGMVMVVGSAVLLAFRHYERQAMQLEATEERLELTQKELLSKVQLSEEQKRQLQVINAFSNMLSQTFKLDQLLRALTNMVMDVMEVEVVLIFSLGKDGESMNLVAHKGIGKGSAKNLKVMKLEDGLCGHASKIDHFLVADSLKDNLMLQNEEGLSAGVSVSLMANGKLMGSMCVATRSDRQFTEPDLELLSALGNLVGIAMRTVDLYHEKEGVIDQLADTINQLERSERKYRKLFENAHDAIWVQDLLGKIVDANRAAAELFGCELSELVGADTQRFLPKKDAEFLIEIQQKMLNANDDILPYKQKIIKNDSTQASVMLTTNLMSTNGSPEGFQFIGKDITKEVRMQENQRFYLKQITKGHEEERQRISRDLHDSTAQNLLTLLRHLESFIEENGQLPEPKLASLEGFQKQLRDALQEIRQLSRDLRPSVLDALGLFPAVDWLTEQIKTEYGIETNLTITGEERRFSPETEITLFRIVQEALRNAVKHAEATECNIDIELIDSEIRVAISDNGKGFELPATLGDLSLNGKLGIDGMQTRARLVGGTFDIKSRPTEGTTILVTIPTT